MRSNMLTLLTPLVLACGQTTASSNAGLLAEHHPPLRSPCIATEVPLRQGLRVTCGAAPSSPELGDGDVWRGALPSSGRWTLPDGSTSVVRYDYASPYTYSAATYRADGNLDTATFAVVAPDDPPVIHYTYDGDTLVGAYVARGDGTIDAETEVVYADGRRAYEGLVGNPGSRLHYTYDASGRVVSRIGGCARGRVPDLPDPAMLSDACPTFGVPDPLPSMDPRVDCAVTYYFRDVQGRITHVLNGATVGLPMDRTDLTWDGDRLLSADRRCSGAPDPVLQDGRIDYTY